MPIVPLPIAIAICVAQYGANRMKKIDSLSRMSNSDEILTRSIKFIFIQIIRNQNSTTFLDVFHIQREEKNNFFNDGYFDDFYDSLTRLKYN